MLYGINSNCELFLPIARSSFPSYFPFCFCSLLLQLLCASAEKLHARGPLPVKEIAIYYDRWEGEGSLCSLQDTDRDFPSFPIGISPRRLHPRDTWFVA